MEYTQQQLETLWNILSNLLANHPEADQAEGELKGDWFHLFIRDTVEVDSFQIDMGDLGTIRIEERTQDEDLNMTTGEWETVDRTCYWAEDFSEDGGAEVVVGNVIALLQAEMNSNIKPIHSIYFGVAIYKRSNGWACDIIDGEFSTLQQVKFYIKDWHETEPQCRKEKQEVK